MGRPRLPLGSHGNIKTWEDRPGVWVARCGYRDLDGRVRPVERSGKSETAAENALKKALANRKPPPKGGKITRDTRLDKVFEKWVEVELTRRIGRGKFSQGSLETYTYQWRHSLKDRIGDLASSEFDTPTALEVLTDIDERSPSQAATCKSVLLGMCSFAVRMGAMDSNPVREVGSFTSTTEREDVHYKPDQIKAWLDHIEQKEKAVRWDLPDLTRLMIATGMRTGELLALAWNDLFLDGDPDDEEFPHEPKILVRFRLKRYAGIGLVRERGRKREKKRNGKKYGKGLSLYLPPYAVRMLRRRRLELQLRGFPADDDTLPILPDSFGGWRDPTNVTRVIREVRADSPFPEFIPYDLRKSVALILRAGGATADEIADQLGNSVQVARKFYIPVSTGNGRRQVQILESAAVW